MPADPAGGSTDDELELVDELAAELGRPPRRPVRVEWEGAGQRISGLRWGSGPPTLVLLHGGSLNAHSWDAMLLLHDVAALALDLPGHGRSSWFDEPLYLPEAVAAAIAPALADLAPDALGIAGHSLGGLSALALAASHPELVRRLILVDATPGSTPDRSQDILDFVGMAEFESLDAMIDHAGAHGPTRSRESLRRSVLQNARQRADGRWTWRHDGRDHPTLDRWEVMFDVIPKGWDHARSLRCPTLVIRGSRSPILTPEDVEHYRQVVRDLSVVVMEGAGHNIHGQQPGALGAAIIEFLQDR